MSKVKEIIKTLQQIQKNAKRQQRRLILRACSVLDHDMIVWEDVLINSIKLTIDCLRA